MIRLVILATLAPLAVSACGGGSSDGTPSTRASAVSGGKAATYILTEDELPDGWRYATGEQYLGVPKSCGVTLEPPSLASAKTRRFTRGSTGPFVIQYSFVSSDAKATTQRIDEFVRATRTCQTYKPEKDVVVAVNRITDLEPVGDAFGAVHEREVGEPTHVQDIVSFRNGAVVTVLQSYSPATLADRADLAEMVAAISAKQP